LLCLHTLSKKYTEQLERYTTKKDNREKINKRRCRQKEFMGIRERTKRKGSAKKEKERQKGRNVI
jgi:hypothetical protein